jgi:hypothetical protein
MSLINDALKKAARQRAEEQADVVAPMPGGARRVPRQGAPMKTQTMILVGAAALALIVVSVVVTGIMMTSKPEAGPAAATAQAAPPAQSPAPKIVVQAPAITVAAPQRSAPAPTPTPVPVVEALPTPTPSPLPVVQAPAPAAASAPAAAGAASQSHTDMVQAVIDAYHISGVRLSGAGSKALVDGRVYKLNDIVDKALGLKLVKVDEDHLTFVDRDGATFVRNF